MNILQGKIMAKMIRKCPDCGEENPSSANYCISCRAILSLCPNCKGKLPPDAKFCPYCGDRFTTDNPCISCGRPIRIDYAICPYCGYDYKRGHLTDGTMILAYIVSFLFPIAGIIIGVIWRSHSDLSRKNAGNICITIAAISIGLGITFMLLIMGALLNFELP